MWQGTIVLAAALLGGCGTVQNNLVCGDGTVESGESCDEGAANGTAGSCCTVECELVPASETCRAAAGECDVAETCTGSDGACPADETLADDMPCGDTTTSACSAPDTCRAGACEPNHAAVGTACGLNGACSDDACDDAGACVNPAPGARRIAIIESSQSVPGQNQDMRWLALATGLGHTAAILPQTTLDDLTALMASYDIIILASHYQTGTVVPQNRRDNLVQFVQAGRGVYIQGEYSAPMFDGNKVWEAVVDVLGANFTWGQEIQGSMSTTADGCWGTTPMMVDTMTQNFAHAGSATGVGFGSIQTMTNLPIGFRYCRAGGGLVVTTTDKDGFNQQTPGWNAFFGNILYRLSYPSSCPM